MPPEYEDFTERIIKENERLKRRVDDLGIITAVLAIMLVALALFTAAQTKAINSSNQNSSNSLPTVTQAPRPTSNPTPNPTPRHTPKPTPKPYSFYVWASCSIEENDSVGDEWFYSLTIDGVDVTSGAFIDIRENQELNIVATCTENGSVPDTNSVSAPADATVVNDIINNRITSLRIPVTVTENRGKYSGNKAVCEVTIYFEKQ